jgi:hypothetical protein
MYRRYLVWKNLNKKLPIFHDDINLPFCLILIYLLNFTMCPTLVSPAFYESVICAWGGGGGRGGEGLRW